MTLAVNTKMTNTLCLFIIQQWQVTSQQNLYQMIFIFKAIVNIYSIIS